MKDRLLVLLVGAVLLAFGGGILAGAELKGGAQAEVVSVTPAPQYPFLRDVAVPRYIWLAFALEQNLLPDCTAIGSRFRKLYDALDATGQSNLLQNTRDGAWAQITCTVTPLVP